MKLENIKPKNMKLKKLVTILIGSALIIEGCGGGCGSAVSSGDRAETETIMIQGTEAIQETETIQGTGSMQETETTQGNEFVHDTETIIGSKDETFEETKYSDEIPVEVDIPAVGEKIAAGLIGDKETKKQTDEAAAAKTADPVTEVSGTESSGGKGTANKGNPQTKPPETQHTHTWVAQTTTVHHDAVTEQVWVQDSEAWDEAVYSTKIVCGCGAQFDSVEGANGWEYHSAFGCPYGYSVQSVQTGTIRHEATGHYETKVIQQAYDETVTTGYVCSGCAATK